MPQHVFEALYTPQLVQKRKIWHDGRCIYHESPRKVVLLDDEGRVLGERFWTGEDVPEAGTTVQVDRYLVELDALLRVVSDQPLPEARRARSPARHPHLRPLSRQVSTNAAIGPAPSLMSGERPLSDVLHEASKQIKPLGSVRAERRVKRVKADKFGGLSPALMVPASGPGKSVAGGWTTGAGIPRSIGSTRSISSGALGGEVDIRRALATNTLKSELLEIAPELSEVPGEITRGSSTEFPVEAQAGEASAELNPGPGLSADNTELFVDDSWGFEPFESFASSNASGNHEQSQHEQDSDDLFSDTEVEVVDVTPVKRTRRSLFEDMPVDGPQEGPWTKEAYLLFSWHPPHGPPIKAEPV